ncbi:hypothetical protein HPP92_004411 [Vanilla planifolia]|uniref:Cation/H+ exchanger domain-containing protein n=1 Tax=Vanilla planifolia TaxID=51239 RepID=A0A835VJV3_VANPL|nr:hypothetical protein HPP92_004411 [Vanilla planifolia]
MRISAFSFSVYLFVIGLEMEPRTILSSTGPATKIACAGIFSTVSINLLCYSAINFTGLDLAMRHPYHIISALSVLFAATSSPILTRLIIELKIGKSEIGRLAVRTGVANDMICTSVICIGTILCSHSFKNNGASYHSIALRTVLHFVILSLEGCLIVKVVNPFFGLLNDRNPEGKPIRGIDMVLVCIVSALLCYGGAIFGFNANFNAFIVGLCLRRDGRMSNFLISRINFVLSTLLLPLYLVLVGMSSDYNSWLYDDHHDGAGTHEQRTVCKLLVVGTIGAVGKLTGTVAYSVSQGLQWPEAVALGLLLNVKGYFHIFCAFYAASEHLIDANTMMVLIMVTVGTVVPTPLVVALIVRRARPRAQGTARGLQWHDPRWEMRILLGLHGPQDVPMAVNVMEALRAAGMGESWRLIAYVVDMVEMTDKAAASLVQGEGMEAVTVTDEGIVEMREHIQSALEAYTEENGEGVQIRRILAVSSFEDMHKDICSGAQDCMAVMVVLPFHRRQRVDGAMDSGHPGFRLVNQKVLQAAPCSVGIIIDRGFGRSGAQMSLSVASQNTCVVFIGGGDDREALAYAGRMAHHPGIRLMVVRFLPDASARGKASGPGRRVLTSIVKQETELKSDDEYVAGFYEKYVSGGKGVGYMEKHVSSGAEMVATLRALEGQYHLFVVGRGKERDSILTAGMSEWAECPELGPIGDILAASDFTVTASVLVIQQHNIAKNFDVIDEEFLSSKIVHSSYF